MVTGRARAPCPHRAKPALLSPDLTGGRAELLDQCGEQGEPKSARTAQPGSDPPLPASRPTTPPCSQPWAPHPRSPEHGTSTGSPFSSPPQLRTGPRMIIPRTTLPAVPQLPWQHRTASPWHGLPPRGNEPSGQNTCSLQMSGSCSWDAGKPGECWGWAVSWASLRSRALLSCLLTPSWVCLWPGRAANAACRSAQADRGGLPATGAACRTGGQGGPPPVALCPADPGAASAWWPLGKRRRGPGGRHAPQHSGVCRQPTLQTD